jgi:hypothetical protein
VKKLREETGQALIIALGFMFFFALVIGVVLWFAEASVRTTENLREQRNIVYAADGAMDAAIQYGRWNLSVGAFGAVPCMAVSPYTQTLNGQTATVTCESLGNPLAEDRRVRFTATVGGINRVKVDVLYHATSTAPAPVVDVLSWKYLT